MDDDKLLREALAAWYEEPRDDIAPSEVWWDSYRDAWIDGWMNGKQSGTKAAKEHRSGLV